jgi:hypothetical protein
LLFCLTTELALMLCGAVLCSHCTVLGGADMSDCKVPGSGGGSLGLTIRSEVMRVTPLLPEIIGIVVRYCTADRGPHTPHRTSHPLPALRRRLTSVAVCLLCSARCSGPCALSDWSAAKAEVWRASGDADADGDDAADEKAAGAAAAPVAVKASAMAYDAVLQRLIWVDKVRVVL